MSAGNLPNENIGARYPRVYGGTATPFSRRRRGGMPTAIGWMIQAGWTAVVVASYRCTSWLIRPSDPALTQTIDIYRHGTSPAAAMTAGMAARLLARGVAPADVKRQLQQDGMRLKGFDWPRRRRLVRPLRRDGHSGSFVRSRLPGVYFRLQHIPPSRVPKCWVLTLRHHFRSLLLQSSTCYTVTSRAPATLPTDDA